jgi:carbohydrate kinase (thermoresistant glucokinase family)
MSTTPAEAPIVVVMGVSGSGKSTIGELVAEALSVPFIDADSLHPVANVEKMAAGHPLTDEDRWPWLATVGKALAAADATGAVVACSALKRVYRDAILAEAPRALFLHLTGSREVLASRLERRSGHFMPPTLLDSQLKTLEPLAEDEPGIVVDIAPDVMTIVSDAVAGVRERLAASAAES